MHSNCTRKLLGLEDILIKNVIQADLLFEFTLKQSQQHRPALNVAAIPNVLMITALRIKDLPFQLKHTYLF